jgi:HSP20 family protein
MPLVPKEPLELFSLFQKQMEDLFAFLEEVELGKRSRETGHTPLVDIFETPEALVVEVELPGFEIRDISLRMFRNILVIEGVKRKEHCGGVTYICLERRFGRFTRIMEIPPDVDIEKARATCNQGVLWVSFPKLSHTSSTVKVIPIEQGDGNGKQN